eukprot:635114-Amphidinium_carterae.1
MSVTMLVFHKLMCPYFASAMASFRIHSRTAACSSTLPAGLKVADAHESKGAQRNATQLRRFGRICLVHYSSACNGLHEFALSAC